MSYPNTGSTPNQDPNYNSQGGYQPPATGSQPTSDWQAQSPTTGSQPAYGQQYGAQQEGYGQQGYGQQGYSQPQYGGGFPNAPQAYGNAPTGARPGTATTAAVLGFIFGTIGFVFGAIGLIGLTSGTESGLFAQAGIDGFPLIANYIGIILLLASSVMVFIGAVQLLTGKSNKMIVLACVVFIVAEIFNIISSLSATGGDGVATALVIVIVAVLLAGMLIFLSKSKDVEKWLARKNAARAAGYED